MKGYANVLNAQKHLPSFFLTKSGDCRPLYGIASNRVNQKFIFDCIGFIIQLLYLGSQQKERAVVELRLFEKEIITALKITYWSFKAGQTC